jgi:hypothetical protein
MENGPCIGALEIGPNANFGRRPRPGRTDRSGRQQACGGHGEARASPASLCRLRRVGGIVCGRANGAARMAEPRIEGREHQQRE